MIEELLKFSLIGRLAETQMLSIHRLIQAVQMDSMELEVQHRLAEQVVRAVNVVFPSDYLATHDEQHLRYLDQVEACNILIGQHKLFFTENADLLTRTGLYLDLHTLFSVAEPLFLRALEIREQVLEAGHPDIANSLRNLAEVYRAQRKYNKAELLFLRALKIQEQVLEAGRLDIADTLHYLAQLY
jgi:tetratricopeptide (TPR) repeat protein